MDQQKQIAELYRVNPTAVDPAGGLAALDNIPEAVDNTARVLRAVPSTPNYRNLVAGGGGGGGGGGGRNLVGGSKIKTVKSKNGITMYYLNGKRISKMEAEKKK